MQNFSPSSLCPCKPNGTIKETRCVRRRSLQRKCNRDITCARYSCWLGTWGRYHRRPAVEAVAETYRVLATGHRRELSRCATMFSIAFGSDNRGVVPEPLTQWVVRYYVAFASST